MTVSTRTPFAFTEMILTPVSQLPAAVPAKAGVAGLKSELQSAARELALQDGERAVVTRDIWEVVQHRPLQSVASLLRRQKFTDPAGLLLGPLLTGAMGLFVGGFTAVATHSEPVGLCVCLLGAGAAVCLAPTVIAIDKLAARQERQARGKMVELEEVEGPLKRFTAATDSEKVQIASGLEKLQETLDGSRALAPEARSALKAAIAEGKSLADTHAERIRQIASLAGIIGSEIDRDAVKRADAALQQLSPSERPIAAQALHELVFADRKRVAAMKYDARNALHELLTAPPQASKEQSAA